MVSDVRVGMGVCPVICGMVTFPRSGLTGYDKGWDVRVLTVSISFCRKLIIYVL